MHTKKNRGKDRLLLDTSVIIRSHFSSDMYVHCEEQRVQYVWQKCVYIAVPKYVVCT